VREVEYADAEFLVDFPDDRRAVRLAELDAPADESVIATRGVSAVGSFTLTRWPEPSAFGAMIIAFTRTRERSMVMGLCLLPATLQSAPDDDCKDHRAGPHEERRSDRGRSEVDGPGDADDVSEHDGEAHDPDRVETREEWLDDRRSGDVLRADRPRSRCPCPRARDREG
jgi:hypothetical protein